VQVHRQVLGRGVEELGGLREARAEHPYVVGKSCALAVLTLDRRVRKP
jgi:hypothetical protein